jgi:hypothetical protein
MAWRFVLKNAHIGVGCLSEFCPAAYQRAADNSIAKACIIPSENWGVSATAEVDGKV